MTKRIKYTEEPMQTGKIVKDFLPGPGNLVFRKEGTVVSGQIPFTDFSPRPISAT
jgi:hypothetical protein